MSGGSHRRNSRSPPRRTGANAGAGAAAAAPPPPPPGMQTQQRPNAGWGRGAVRGGSASTPGIAPPPGMRGGATAMTPPGIAPPPGMSPMGRNAPNPPQGGANRRPSMFDYAARGQQGHGSGVSSPAYPPVPTMGRTNATPRPGFDVAPPPGMGEQSQQQRPRPSLLASVRTNARPSLLSQQRPPAVMIEPPTHQGSGMTTSTTATSGLESGELMPTPGGGATPTPTSDANTPKKRKLGGWGQALARSKTPTTAMGTDAPSALREETTPATTPKTADRGGWGQAMARAQQSAPATTERAVAIETPSVDPDAVKKARAAEQRLKVTKEALLGQMERVDGEVASLEKELEALKNSAEEEKHGAALDSKDELSRHRKETEALRLRLSNAERAAARAQEYAANKLREAATMARETGTNRSRKASAEVQALNRRAASEAAKSIKTMMDRQGSRIKHVEADFKHNKKLAADAVKRVKTEFGLELAKDVKLVDFNAIVAREVEHAKTPYMIEVARKVKEVLQKRKDAVSARNYTNALAYIKQREIWRVKMVREANDALAKDFVGGKKTFTPGSRASGRNRSSNDLGGVARSEYEEMQIIKSLQRKEELRHMTTIPDMVLDPQQLRWEIFDSRNNLVEDPVAERDRINLIRPWTKAEKKIFHEKFNSYGKNFRRIAEHLEGRDTGDCVMYYYKFQKTDEGFRGRRRAAAKKRRAYAEAQRQRAFDPATVEAQREERSAPTAEARLERAALAAAAKAAKAKARAEKAKAKAARDAEEAKKNADKPPSKGPEWTDMEKTKFVSGLLQYGKDFVAISSTIRTRSLDAVKQFYVDNREAMDLDSLVGGG